MIDYPPYFKKEELQCFCQDPDCWGKLQEMDSVFMNYLIAAREMAQIPFIISSGARCAEHNQAIGGVFGSSHLATIKRQPCAVDIACSGASAYKIVRALIRVGMSGIGVSQKKGEPKFIHVDNKQDDINRPFLWSY